VATNVDWAEAYLAQARVDLEGARLVQAIPSVFAMLLQMSFEKLAKAALLKSGAIHLEHAKSTHRAASHMVRLLRLQRQKMKALGGAIVWEDVLSVVPELERVHSALVQAGPQLEYPFELREGVVGWPARDLPIARVLGSARKGNLGRRVLDFADKLSANFDAVFPLPASRTR
jgi:hypothetical protein